MGAGGRGPRLARRAYRRWVALGPRTCQDLGHWRWQWRDMASWTPSHDPAAVAAVLRRSTLSTNQPRQRRRQRPRTTRTTHPVRSEGAPSTPKLAAAPRWMTAGECRVTGITIEHIDVVGTSGAMVARCVTAERRGRRRTPSAPKPRWSTRSPTSSKAVWPHYGSGQGSTQPPSSARWSGSRSET